jgi:hypothetical protein
MPFDRRGTPRVATTAHGQLIFESCAVLPYFVPVQLMNASESGVLLSAPELIEVGRRTELCIGFGPRRRLEVQRLVDTGTDGDGRFQIGARVVSPDARLKTRRGAAVHKLIWSLPEAAWARVGRARLGTI